MHRWKDEPSDPDNPWSPPKGQGEAGQDIDWDYRPNAAPNPFYTAVRGIKEEVGKEIAEQVDPKDIRFISLAWDLVGFNPHLYAYVQLPIGKDRLIQLARASRADDSWESSGVWVPFEPSGTLKSYLFSNSWAEISKGAVLRALVHHYGYEAVDLALQ